MQRHCIIHLPQHVEFELQDFEGAFLRHARIEPIEREGEPELDVAARDADPALKVPESLRIDPRIVFRPVGETLFVDFGGEQLGQG